MALIYSLSHSLSLKRRHCTYSHPLPFSLLHSLSDCGKRERERPKGISIFVCKKTNQAGRNFGAHTGTFI
jgi:hypothetical protein